MYPITDRAKAILAQVAAEAARRHEAVVEPETILRGILREGKGVACRALGRLGVHPATISVPDPPSPTLLAHPAVSLGEVDGLPPDLAATAEAEATALGHRYIGTEHLLLALAGPGCPRVAAALAAHGVSLPAARATVAQLLGRQLPER